VAPEVLSTVNPILQQKVIAFYCVLAVAALVVFLPWVRRDKTAAFWFAVMVLAAIPAATVVPCSKNLGFVAVGAYGLIASFVAGLMTQPSRLPEGLAYRTPAWIACVLLILAHVPGAAAGRVAAVKVVPLLFDRGNRLCDVGDWPNIENENVIIINALPLALVHAPSYKAYHHQPLPKTLRALVPAGTSFDVQRTDDKTLVIQSKAPDIFSCDNVGPIHSAYACRTLDLLVGGPRCKKGDRYDLDGLTVEVLESDASDLPSRVAFRFDTSLDSPDFHWLRFDWQTRGYQPYQPFKIPAIGQSVTLSGPHR
jgi:hypothetical protein